MPPRVVLLRGHHANVWDLRPWELLRDEFDVRVLVTGSNLHQTGGLELDVVPIRTPRDLLPRGRVAGAAAYALGERYLRLDRALAGADVVHAAEIGSWYSAQAAARKARHGFKLALTVWETIPWRASYRWPRERAYRRSVLPAVDLFLPATDRALDALRLEGVEMDRCRVCPPGIDIARFESSAPAPPPPASKLVLSAGRLVWEKGHQDVIRAVAAVRGGLLQEPADDVKLLIVGSGPEEKRLRQYAGELGLGDAVEIRPTVPYEQMPSLYASASALVLASLPTRGWEEQFGMVLVEAMASGTPVLASASGAIPEVLGGQGALFSPGDWRALARLLLDGPLAERRADGGSYDREALARFSTAAAAERLRAAYRSLLAESAAS
jgi:glycosyltransferase involved in cell wall biosynthesis